MKKIIILCLLVTILIGLIGCSTIEKSSQTLVESRSTKEVNIEPTQPEDVEEKDIESTTGKRCGQDNDCFLQHLKSCTKGVTFENCNMIVGCQKAEILGEEQGKCKVHRWDETLEGKQINIDKICLISKNYDPPHFWVTDGMC